MPKTVINNAQGVNVKSGNGTSIKNAATFSGDIVQATSPVTTLQAKTAAATLTQPGTYTISGSAALSMVMPLASAVPGGVFSFRAISAHAHTITGSAETSGVTVFCDPPGAGSTHGSKMSLGGDVGNSAVVISDGKNFCVLAGSGSLSLSGL